MDMNGQLHASANLHQWKTLPLSIQLEVRWANLDTEEQNLLSSLGIKGLLVIQFVS
jgi:type II secretory pathway component PulM